MNAKTKSPQAVQGRRGFLDTMEHNNANLTAPSAARQTRSTIRRTWEPCHLCCRFGESEPRAIFGYADAPCGHPGNVVALCLSCFRNATDFGLKQAGEVDNG